MIARFLWGYLCITGISSLLVYCACMAAARADRIRQELSTKEPPVSTKPECKQQNRYYIYPSPLDPVTGKRTSPLRGSS